MQISKLARLLFCAWLSMACVQSSYAGELDVLIDRLQQTRAKNVKNIIDAQFEDAEPAPGFLVADPYTPAAQVTVESWNRFSEKEPTVCAIHFVDEHKEQYEMQNFGSASAAHNAGFVVTHQGRCGSCSTLRDLSRYLALPDLTTPARQCARKWGMQRKKQCFQEEIGFTTHCAESWAYNARHTRQECRSDCVADYGFINLVLHRYPGPNVLESGQLRPCLQCDEDKSGPGFKFSAGRTRRNSGIESAIKRPDSELYKLDHSAYFE